MRLEVNVPIPVPLLVMLFAIVGFGLVLQQIPRAVIALAPWYVIVPPETAVVCAMLLTAVVVKTARLGHKFVVVVAGQFCTCKFAPSFTVSKAPALEKMERSFVVNGIFTGLQQRGTYSGLQLHALCQSVSTAPVHVSVSAKVKLTDSASVHPPEPVPVTVYCVELDGVT